MFEASFNRQNLNILTEMSNIKSIVTLKWLIFTRFYFRYIHDLLMDHTNSTPHELLINDITHTVNVTSRYMKIIWQQI